jgi:signal transduction histidine kinase
MASAFHVAAVFVLPPPVLVLAGAAGRLAVNLFVYRVAWYRALFNTGQIAVTLFASWLALDLVAGARAFSTGAVPFPLYLVGGVAVILVYYVFNTGLVSGILAIVERKSVTAAWRDSFGYRGGLIGSAALFLLAPIAAITYRIIGIPGLAVLILPTYFIRLNWKHANEVRLAQDATVARTRLAAMGELASVVGCELNEFVAGLATNLSALKGSGSDLSPADRIARLEQLTRQVEEMATLSRSLMDNSALEIQRIPVNVIDLVKETLADLREKPYLAGVFLRTEWSGEAGMVHVDPRQLSHAVRELVRNAGEAALSERSASPFVIVRTRWTQGGHHLEIMVEDSGPGLPPDVIERVLEPGFTTKENGNGFGLAMVDRVARSHGGTLIAENVPGGGARFILRIPTHPAVSRAA